MTEIVSIVIMFMVGALAYGLFYVFLFNTINAVRRAILRLKLDRMIKDKRQGYIDHHEEMRARGELHEYINIKVMIPSGEMVDKLICKKSGWCPETKNYYTREFIKKEIQRQELAEQYKMYRDIEVGCLAIRYKLDRDVMEKIVEDVFNIKKSFHLKKINKELKNLQQG